MTLDPDYQNGAFIRDADSFPPSWRAAAAAFRAQTRCTLAVPCGPGPRQTYDLFHPQGDPLGLMVFIHGGYWKAFAPADWSHLAAGAIARGWACAMLGYTLAPDARIKAITREIAQGIAVASAQVAGPIVVTGHSAGGHLAARMGCSDIAITDRVKRVVPISPISELAPLMQTAMNDTLGITAKEAARESPARLTLRPGVGAHVWVGGQERPAFLWQARLLSEAWDCPWTVATGLHHFNVVDDLTLPDSTLMGVLTDGL